eukprot:SAG11_NODE_188_length_13029_cov_3.652514_4_plen_75_part_00
MYQFVLCFKKKKINEMVEMLIIFVVLFFLGQHGDEGDQEEGDQEEFKQVSSLTLGLGKRPASVCGKDRFVSEEK